MYRRKTRFSRPSYARDTEDDSKDQPITQNQSRYADIGSSTTNSSRLKSRLVNLKPREGFELRPFYKSAFNQGAELVEDGDHVSNNDRYRSIYDINGFQGTTPESADLDKKPDYTPYKPTMHDDYYHDTAVNNDSYNRIINANYNRNYNRNFNSGTSYDVRSEVPSTYKRDIGLTDYETKALNGCRSPLTLPTKLDNDYLEGKMNYNSDLTSNNTNLSGLAPYNNLERRRPSNKYDHLRNRSSSYNYKKVDDIINTRPIHFTTTDAENNYVNSGDKNSDVTISNEKDEFGGDKIDYSTFYQDKLGTNINRTSNIKWNNNNYQSDIDPDTAATGYNRPSDWRSTLRNKITDVNKPKMDLAAIFSRNRLQADRNQLGFSSLGNQTDNISSPLNSTPTKPIEALIRSLQQQDETLSLEDARRIVFEGLQTDYATLRDVIKDIDSQITVQQHLYEEIIDIINSGDSTWRFHGVWGNVVFQLKARLYDFIVKVMVPAVFSLIIFFFLYITLKIFTFIWYWDPI